MATNFHKIAVRSVRSEISTTRRLFTLFRFNFVCLSSNPRKLLLSRCYVIENKRFYPSKNIKVPRSLRKSQDNEQIKKYLLIKKLCFENNSTEALSLMTIWLNEAKTVDKNMVLLLNALLHCLNDENKHKEIDILVDLMNKKLINGDKSTYKILIDSFCKRNDLSIVEYFLQKQNKFGIKRHEQSLILFIKLLMNNGDYHKAMINFQKLENYERERNDSFCAWFINKITETAFKSAGNIERILYDYMRKQTRMGNETLLEIKRYFDSSNQYKTCYTEISPKDGICKNCSQILKEAVFGEKEKQLISYFENIINENMKNVMLKFFEKKGPFDVIVDGLNVAIHPSRGMQFQTLYQLASSFHKDKKRVVVIAANDLISAKNTTVMKEHQNYLNKLREICDVYNVKQNTRGIDDVVLILMSLYSFRENVPVNIISNDQFMDHVSKMPHEIVRCFQRWLEEHQMKITNYNKPSFKVPNRYSTVVQTTQSKQNKVIWHIPSANNNEWICVQKL